MRIALVVASLFAPLFVAAPSWAATITVNAATGGLQTNGDCTLEEAFLAAQDESTVDACVAGDGNDTIVFDASLTGLEIDVVDIPLTVAHSVVVDGIDVPGASIAFQNNTQLVVQGQLTLQNVDVAHARTNTTLISAQHTMALVNVTFVDDQVGSSILRSEGADPAVTLTNVVVDGCDTQGSAVIELTEAQAVHFDNVSISNVNAPALDLDATGPVVMNNVTIDHIDATGFGPVAIIGRGPQITNLAVTNVATDNSDAVVINADILRASSATTITVNTCDAQTNCVHWGADGTVRFATFSNVTAPFAFLVAPGGLDVTVTDTTIASSNGGLHAIHAGGLGGIHIDRLQQANVGAIDRDLPTLQLESNGSTAQIDATHVTVDANVVGAGATAVVEIEGGGAATSTSLGQTTISGCSGPTILALASSGIDVVQADRVTITGATGDHALLLDPGSSGVLTSSRARLESNTLTGAQIVDFGGVVTEAIVVGGNAVELHNDSNQQFVELRSSTIALADTGVTCTGNVNVFDTLLGPDVTTPNNGCTLAGNGNLVGVDPLYTAPATIDGDFTLQTGSPAIDVGVRPFNGLAAVDFADHIRVQGPAVDVGAFEFPQAPAGEGEGEGSAGEGEGGVGEGEGEGEGGAGEGEGGVGEGEGAASEGEGGVGEGEGAASEGEGEGANGGGGKKNAAPPGCGCADSKPDALGVVVALAFVVRRRRKPTA